jgi:hypothetical protein
MAVPKGGSSPISQRSAQKNESQREAVRQHKSQHGNPTLTSRAGDKKLSKAEPASGGCCSMHHLCESRAGQTPGRRFLGHCHMQGSGAAAGGPSALGTRAAAAQRASNVAGEPQGRQALLLLLLQGPNRPSSVPVAGRHGGLDAVQDVAYAGHLARRQLGVHLQRKRFQVPCPATRVQELRRQLLLLGCRDESRLAAGLPAQLLATAELHCSC